MYDDQYIWPGTSGTDAEEGAMECSSPRGADGEKKSRPKPGFAESGGNHRRLARSVWSPIVEPCRADSRSQLSRGIGECRDREASKARGRGCEWFNMAAGVDGSEPSGKTKETRGPVVPTCVALHHRSGTSRDINRSAVSPSRRAGSRCLQRRAALAVARERRHCAGPGPSLCCKCRNTTGAHHQLR